MPVPGLHITVMVMLVVVVIVSIAGGCCHGNNWLGGYCGRRWILQERRSGSMVVTRSIQKVVTVEGGEHSKSIGMCN